MGTMIELVVMNHRDNKVAKKRKSSDHNVGINRNGLIIPCVSEGMSKRLRKTWQRGLAHWH